VRLNPRKRIPDPSKSSEPIVEGNIPFQILDSLMKHFFPDRTPNKYSQTLLRTTILALTLHIPPPSLNSGQNVLVTEPSDIALDLAIDKTEVTTLLRELGCKIDSGREGELERWGLAKIMKRKMDAEGEEMKVPKPKFAKLTFPVEFPKVSQGRALTKQGARRR